MNAFMTWLNKRLPITNTVERHLTKHPVPAKVNFWYLFGALSMVVMIMQFVSGIWLAMSYTPSADLAFESVEYIMRDVDMGWILRYLHSTGASFFFILVYLHMFRGLMYGSYREPREMVWIFGMILFLLLMMEGFTGYVLPWGQMSFWAAQVIVSLFGAVPVVGDVIVDWVRGDYLISDITLSRFFIFHILLLPLLLVAMVFLHLVSLHEVGAGNPEGEDMEADRDEHGIPKGSIPFYPYKVVHAVYATGIMLAVFFSVMFLIPHFGGYFLEAANFETANPLKTPDHIVPVWYFTPFYAMLRACTYPLFGMDAKFWGLVTMGSAIIFPMLLPWLDRSKAVSIRYKGTISKVMLGSLVISFFILGYLGSVPATEGRTILAQICTILYFGYFIFMPLYTKYEKVKKTQIETEQS